ncbi:MAG: Tex family protein [Flavobacteriales bacterium]
MYSKSQFEATVRLLEEGCTVPFIARYRKEATSGLDEVQIEEIRKENLRLKELAKRKQTVLSTIEEQGKLTPELRKQIESCDDLQVLEDIYMPYKPKRRTKAAVAREHGLEPLAEWILKEPNGDVVKEAARFLNDNVKNEEEALQGARDIIAEVISENALVRATVRSQFQRFGTIKTRVARDKETEGIKYKDYFEFEEPLHKCPSHRVLAMFRGEEEGMLRLRISPEEDRTLEKLEYQLIKRNTDASDEIYTALKDSYKRLIEPSIENEFRALCKAKADEEAIKVFAENLRQLLLGAPLGGKRILALDPGYRTGCKVVCLNEEGTLVHDSVIYPHEPQREVAKSSEAIRALVSRFQIQAIAVGNGTAGRETEQFVRNLQLSGIDIFLVNESGASIYSASEIAREEFPDKDVTVRGAVSIGRRLADPLSELVKIDPKSIGVGQYQHDVDQSKLKESLDAVVLSCVNNVGVNVNSASKSLLTYVSGLGPKLAENIVKYREENGPFSSRAALKKVPKLGEKSFEQSAGFLRIPGAKNPLDNSAVHPESYSVVEKMAKDMGCTIIDLIANENLRKQINPSNYVTAQFGLPTIQDILKELAKPGRDPRSSIEVFSFADVKSPEDLHVGMELPGIITNITNFGCFVDVGVKQEGLVHISQITNKFIKDPNEVVKLNQKVRVKVVEVDLQRKRISLTMKL